MGRETREVWVKRVERWRDSGLTVKEFAAEIGVNANTLAGWRWRLGAGSGGNEARKPARSGPAFFEVVATPEEGGGSVAARRPVRAVAQAEAGAGAPFEVVLRSGHRLRVPAHFDAAALRRVVDALEAR